MTTTTPENPLLQSLHTLPPSIRNLLAGGIAGMIAKSFVAPMDRIKIMYQVTSAQFHLRDVPRVALSIVEKEGWGALWKGNTVTMIRVFPYSGIQFMMFDYCKSHILHSKTPATISPTRRQTRNTTPATNPLPNARTNTASTDRKAGLTPIQSLFSGMIAGTVSVFCTYPLDLARAQLAVLRKQKRPKAGDGLALSSGGVQKKGLGYVLGNSFKQGGVRGLYRGITPTLLGILPYSGIAFTINEQGKRQISHICHREPSTTEKMLCGALSGLFAQTLAYPLEITRRRMQTIGIVPTSGSESAAINFMGVSKLKHQIDELEVVEQSAQQSAKGVGKNTANANTASGEGIATTLNKTITSTTNTVKHHKPPSMMLTMQHLYQEQGLRGFFKGVSMNWVKGPFAFSISFTAFDLLQGWAMTESERRRKSELMRGGDQRIQRRLTNNDDI